MVQDILPVNALTLWAHNCNRTGMKVIGVGGRPIIGSRVLDIDNQTLTVLFKKDELMGQHPYEIRSYNKINYTVTTIAISQRAYNQLINSL